MRVTQETSYEDQHKKHMLDRGNQYRTEFSNDVHGSPLVKTNVHELGNDLGLEFVKQTFAKIQMSDVFCIFNLRRAF